MPPEIKWHCLAANENQSAIYLAALAINDLVFLLFDGSALVTGSAGVRVSVLFDFGARRCGHIPHGSCCSRASNIYASACVCDSYESLVQVLLFDVAVSYLIEADILCTVRSYRNWFCEVLFAVQWSAAVFESLIVLSFSVVRLIAIRLPLQVCVVDFSPLFRGPVPNTNPGRLSD